jgi:sialic acid synthase SpsE
MEIEIAGRRIGDSHPVFFIAEAGVNHNGSLTLGKELIDIAIEAGADAVKFQTFKAEELNTVNAPKSTYHIETTGDDSEQTWFELLKTQEISREMHVELMKYCEVRGIIFLSTPYGESSADLLEELDVAAFKIASTDTNNTPFIEYVATKGRPVIVSTAMASLREVELAVATLRNAGLEQFIILQCTGNYPARLADSHLRVLQRYRAQFKCLVGYSDHTPDLINPVAATALGACVYEKHFTIDKSLPGPDHRMSLNLAELKITVEVIRQTELSLGSREKAVLDSEKENRALLRKSIVAKSNLKKGFILERNCVEFKRPGIGIPPSELNSILGKKLRVDIEKNNAITYDALT